MNNTIKLENKGHTQMIAHRGVSGLEPENTHAAFVAAGNRSYYGIEADVHKTADGKFVIMHDGNTLHMSGDDLEIGKATYDTLRMLQLKQMDGQKGRTDLRIPSMAECLQICKHYGKKAVLELKDDFTPQDIAKILEITQEVDYLEHTVFISFKLNNLIMLRQSHPEQQVQYLVEREIDDGLICQLAESKMDIDAYAPRYTPQILAKCREKGIKTNAWTVNDPEQAQNLIDWGIDYLTSNILE